MLQSKKISDHIKGINPKNFSSFDFQLSKLHKQNVQILDCSQDDLLNLIKVCSLVLDPEDYNQYIPKYSNGSINMSSSLDEFTEADILSLESLIPKIANPLIEFRIFDVILCKNNNYKNLKDVFRLGKYIVENYLFVKETEDHFFIPIVTRIVNLQKITKFDKNNDFLNTLVSYSKIKGGDSSVTVERKIEVIKKICNTHKEFSKQAYVEYSEMFKFFKNKANWKFCDLLISQRKELRNRLKLKNKRLNYAHNLIIEKQFLEIESNLKNGTTPSLAGQVVWEIDSLISKAQSNGNSKKLTDKMVLLRKKIIEIFQSGFSELSYTFDVLPLMNFGKNLLTGKPFNEKLMLFGQLAGRGFKPLAVQKQEEIDNIKKSPFSSMFNKVVYDSENNIQKKYPGLTSVNMDQVVENNIFTNESKRQMFCGLGEIEGARNEIVQNFDANSLMQLVLVNNFVPPDRAEIWWKGLEHGFNGKWIECTHLLTAQFENSLRELIKKNGGNPTYTDSETGEQREYDLNAILTKDFLLDKLPELHEDILFICRVLFIDSRGVNIRNKMYHGRLSTQLFNHGYGQFLFALMIWFLVRFQTTVSLTKGNEHSEIP